MAVHVRKAHNNGDDNARLCITFDVGIVDNYEESHINPMCLCRYDCPAEAAMRTRVLDGFSFRFCSYIWEGSSSVAAQDTLAVAPLDPRHAAQRPFSSIRLRSSR
eukprot:4630320-Amphidinium_carterae.1